MEHSDSAIVVAMQHDSDSSATTAASVHRLVIATRLDATRLSVGLRGVSVK
jgi:hypothetical protein